MVIGLSSHMAVFPAVTHVQTPIHGNRWDLINIVRQPIQEHGNGVQDTAALVYFILPMEVSVFIVRARVQRLRTAVRGIIKTAVFVPSVRMVGQRQVIRIQVSAHAIYLQERRCRIRRGHIHAVQMRITPIKNPPIGGFFYLPHAGPMTYSATNGTDSCAMFSMADLILFAKYSACSASHSNTISSCTCIIIWILSVFG